MRLEEVQGRAATNSGAKGWERTCAVCIANRERRLVVVDTLEGRALEREGILGEARACARGASRGDEPEVGGACVYSKAETDVPDVREGVIRPDAEAGQIRVGPGREDRASEGATAEQTYCLSEARARETMVEFWGLMSKPKLWRKSSRERRDEEWLLRRSGLQRGTAKMPSRKARRKKAREAGRICMALCKAGEGACGTASRAKEGAQAVSMRGEGWGGLKEGKAGS